MWTNVQQHRTTRRIPFRHSRQSAFRALAREFRIFAARMRENDFISNTFVRKIETPEVERTRNVKWILPLSVLFDGNTNRAPRAAETQKMKRHATRVECVYGITTREVDARACACADLVQMIQAFQCSYVFKYVYATTKV